MSTDALELLRKCRSCGLAKPLVAFYRDRSRSDGWQVSCKDCQREMRRVNIARQRQRQPEMYSQMAETNRRRYKRLREEIIGLLGGACVRCGTSERLQIDHKNADGPEHRQRYGGFTLAYLQEILEEVQAGSDRYQLLCAPDHGKETRVR